MEMTPAVVLSTALYGKPPDHSGKVRDRYDLDDTYSLFVARDSISAFDKALPNGVPYKGEVLTRMSAWWFENIMEGIRHHFIALVTPQNELDLLGFRLPKEFYGRTMLVKRSLRQVQAEAIVRGNLAGSGWKDYCATGMVCGIPLPEGLLEWQELPHPLFTPSTKAPEGTHDENISLEQFSDNVGATTAITVENLSLEIFQRGRDVAKQRGFIVADAKFEFGIYLDPQGNEVVGLTDEVLTPDSSRFLELAGFTPGVPQFGYDKQLVRDWLSAERRGGRWVEGQTPPAMPPQLVEATTRRYLTIHRMMTGEEIAA